MQETGHGLKMHRSDWTDGEFAKALETPVSNTAMRERFAATSAHMRPRDGCRKMPKLLDGILAGNG